MVDDQQVGRPDAPAGLKVEAFLVPRTVTPQAVAILTLHHVPDVGQRPEIQVGAGAVVRGVGPQFDLAELVELFLFDEGARRPIRRDVKPPQADVV